MPKDETDTSPQPSIENVTAVLYDFEMSGNRLLPKDWFEIVYKEGLATRGFGSSR